MQWVTSNLWDPLRPFWDKLAEFCPKIIAALIVLLVGWILAKILAGLVVKLFKMIKLDYCAEKLGLDAFLRDGEIHMSAMDLVQKASYWILMFCVILLALNALGLSGAEKMFEQVAGFLPSVIFAVVVLVVGGFVARIAQGTILAYLKNIGFTAADLVSKIAQYAIIIATVIIALDQLKIAQIIVQMVAYAFGAICLAFALAFGLGGKEWAAGMIQKWTKK